MAYAALVSLAQTVDEILNYDPYSISSDVKQQIISINQHVIILQRFLEDFPDKANDLEGKIRDLAIGAEDTIEYLMLKLFGSRRQRLDDELRKFIEVAKKTESMSCSRRQKKRDYQVHKLEEVAKYIGSIFCSRRQQLDYKVHEFEKVATKIESIAEHVMTIEGSFKDEQNDYNMHAASSSSRLANTDKQVMVGFDDDLTEIKSRFFGESTKLQVFPEPVNTDKDVMVGFDDDLTEIKARLCGESTKREVIPIFGMGGIGKTTLARYAYNDQLIMETFHIRAWVTISQD